MFERAMRLPPTYDYALFTEEIKATNCSFWFDLKAYRENYVFQIINCTYLENATPYIFNHIYFTKRNKTKLIINKTKIKQNYKLFSGNRNANNTPIVFHNMAN